MLKYVFAAVVLAFCTASAHAYDNNIPVAMCPIEYSYQQCVESGYFNHSGNGTGGGGGTGGYCQNTRVSKMTHYVYCEGSDDQVPCPQELCWNAPDSRTWCPPPQRAGCCPDGSHEGQVAFNEACN